MFDVICLGGANIDLFLDTNVHEHFIDKENELCYPLGMKIRVNNADIFTGGGGSNTAVAFSRMGLKTAYIGKIGGDVNGRIIHDELTKERVKFLGIIDKSSKTDFSVILDSHRHGDRTILNYKDASTKLRYSELKRKYNTKWFYFTSLLDESFETLEHVARKYKGKVHIGFNASSYLAERGLHGLRDILDATTIFVLNKEEAMQLTKGNKVESMMKKIWKYGPDIICITDGEKGSYTYDGEYFYHQKAHKIKVVEKTGAGDAYAATFIAALAKGKTVEEALNMALKNAESVIMNKGAKNVLLSWHGLQNARSRIARKRLR